MSGSDEEELLRAEEAACRLKLNESSKFHQLKIRSENREDPLRGLVKAEEMKRAAAKSLIERYYYQLTEGCRTSNCTNEFCASSGKLKTLSPNHAAIQALQLFRAKARLCEANPAKIAKRPKSPNVADSLGSLDASVSRVNVGGGGGCSSSSYSISPSTSTPMDMDVACSSEMDVGSTTQRTPLITESTETGTSVLASKVKDLLANIYLTESRVLEILDICREEGTYSLLIRTIGQVFSRSDSLVRSFRRGSAPNHQHERPASDSFLMTKEALRATEADQDKDLDSKEMIEDVKCDISAGLRDDEISLDLESLRRTYAALFNIPGLPFQGALVHALFILYDSAKWDLECRNVYERDPDYLNLFFMAFEVPGLGGGGDGDDFLFLPSFCRACCLLPISAQAKMVRVLLKHYGAQRINDLVEVLQQVITARVIAGQAASASASSSSSSTARLEYCVNDDDVVVAATKVMKIFFYASILGGKTDIGCRSQEDDDEEIRSAEGASAPTASRVDKGSRGSAGGPAAREDPLGRELGGITPLDCHRPLVPFSEFYNELLNETIEVERDFTNYRAGQQSSQSSSGGGSEQHGGSAGAASDGRTVKFSFMNYSFILTPATKALGLYYDNRVQMYSERRISALQSILVSDAEFVPYNPYLKLKVRRDHIIDDALIELEMISMENPTDLKKQLVVEFEGEQGIDEGGVSKEFFQIVIDEIFNPNFGMFSLNAETQVYWFNPTSFESDAQFTLIGIVLGLAIYNSVILAIDFPSVVYRKLMGKSGTFEDLADWDPSLHQGLTNLLDYMENDIEEVFMQTFRISYRDIFGNHMTHDLKDKGNQIAVNHANKREFVDLYADFLLNKSVRKQFLAFKRGFSMVTGESPLSWLCRPEEVELLVRGSKIFDFNALEESVEYDGGYTAYTPIIKQFWEIVHDLSHDEKRKLLQFTTGSDRAPVGGLSKLKLVVAKNGSDSNRLPTAHTCFNVLLLPEYSSKEKLKERLVKAINYSKGFGLL